MINKLYQAIVAMSAKLTAVVTEDIFFQYVSSDANGALFYLQSPSAIPAGDRIAFYAAIGR